MTFTGLASDFPVVEDEGKNGPALVEETIVADHGNLVVDGFTNDVPDEAFRGDRPVGDKPQGIHFPEVSFQDRGDVLPRGNGHGDQGHAGRGRLAGLFMESVL